mmetsp:Transcript_45744/g.148713  ORF Transcript_45744/g.148713 Transcript_45744/m.148713 type:complete len:250 (-) Transcript_45744:348-1097(-)
MRGRTRLAPRAPSPRRLRTLQSGCRVTSCRSCSTSPSAPTRPRPCSSPGCRSTRRRPTLRSSRRCTASARSSHSRACRWPSRGLSASRGCSATPLCLPSSTRATAAASSATWFPCPASRTCAACLGCIGTSRRASSLPSPSRRLSCWWLCAGTRRTSRGRWWLTPRSWSRASPPPTWRCSRSTRCRRRSCCPTARQSTRARPSCRSRRGRAAPPPRRSLCPTLARTARAPSVGWSVRRAARRWRRRGSA